VILCLEGERNYLREKQIRLICRVAGLLVVLSLSPLVQAQNQPPIQANEDCLAYAYTRSGQHGFLLENNSIAYGNTVFIRTNCDQLDVYFDGVKQSTYTNQSLIQIYFEGYSLNMTLRSDNYTYYANNVVLFESQFSWSDNYLQYQEQLPQLTFIELGKMTFQENVVSVASIAIVWFLSVNIYWALINHYLDRNLFEEVVE
jgi:hypothetical protein